MFSGCFPKSSGQSPVIDGEVFSVCVASTGTTVQVGAEETLLSALQQADIWPPYSCRQGFCGTCRTRCSTAASTTATRCSPSPSVPTE